MHISDLDDLWPDAAALVARRGATPSARPATAAPAPVELLAAAAKRTPAPPSAVPPPPLTAWEPEVDIAGTPVRPHLTLEALARRAKAALGTFDHVAATYTALGFMAGMAAWHTIGFWGFVSTVVLNSEPAGQRPAVSQPVATAARPMPQITTGTITTGAITTSAISSDVSRSRQLLPRPCVALVIDRSTGEATKANCDDSGPPMREAGLLRRENRAAPPTAPAADLAPWTAETALDATADTNAPSVANQTLTDADVNLEIPAAP
jgi:hypothetical protein